jgi:hypothetical protein
MHKTIMTPYTMTIFNLFILPTFLPSAEGTISY